MLSFIGTQVTVVAVPIQVYRLTGSSFAVGMVGLAGVVPLLVCSLLGGTLADAMDRRRLLLITQTLMGLTSVGLALNASVASPHLWALYVLPAITAGLSGIDAPTRHASVPGLVGADQLTSANALMQIVMQVGQVLGPALAGLLIATVDVAAAFWVDVATFGAAIVALLLMHPMPPVGGTTKAGFKSIAEGLRYLKGRQALQGTFVIDINAMVFGMPRALFPELAQTVFGGGAGVTGLLYAAPGAGALIGALGSGWVLARAPAGTGGAAVGPRVGSRDRRVRLHGVASARAGLPGDRRCRRRRVRRLPQHDPPALGPGSTPRSAVSGAHRGGHRRAAAG